MQKIIPTGWPGNVLAVLLTSSALVMGNSAGFAETAGEKTFQTGNSLAGNYLAARIAATDKDTESAATFFRKALSMDATNPNLQ